MKELNSNHIKVLINIRDKKNDIGLCMGKGMTKDELIKRCGLSASTINRAIRILLQNGYIKEAIKNVNKKSYYISEDGLNMLRLLNKKTI